MAEANAKPVQAVQVPYQGDHDRVTMLSLKADGTADQHNPELIGDKEFALAATKRQFAEASVSAVDVAERGVQRPSGLDVEDIDQDPEVKALQEKHDAAATKAEAAAEKAVNSLGGDLLK